MKYTIKGYAVANSNNELSFTGGTEEFSKEFVEYMNRSKGKSYRLVFVDATIEID